MVKVNKTYSLDIETIKMIEVYTYNGETSRSKLVNDAIKWYIRGDVSELVESHKTLLANYTKVCKQLHGEKPDQKSWWRKLLNISG